MTDTIAAIRAHLDPVAEARPHPPRGASAVLAPLVLIDDHLFFLFERRPDGTTRFAGHLCFPGGRIEPSDRSPLDAALREAEEEVGFPRDAVQVLGHLVDTPDPTGRGVSCFVGVVPHHAVPEQPASPDEVDELLLVPLDDLHQTHRSPLPRLDPWPRHAYRVRDHESRMFPSGERVVQYWHLDAVDHAGTAVLWGFTGGLVAQFLGRIYDWVPPAPPRIVDRYEALLPNGGPAPSGYEGTGTTKRTSRP